MGRADRVRRDEKRTDVFDKPDVDITLGDPKCRWKGNTTVCLRRKQCMRRNSWPRGFSLSLSPGFVRGCETLLFNVQHSGSQGEVSSVQSVVFWTVHSLITAYWILFFAVLFKFTLL